MPKQTDDIISIPLVMQRRNFEALLKAHADGSVIFVTGISLKRTNEYNDDEVRLLTTGSDRNEGRYGFQPDKL